MEDILNSRKHNKKNYYFKPNYFFVGAASGRDKCRLYIAEFDWFKKYRIYLQVKGLIKGDVFDTPALGSAQSDSGKPHNEDNQHIDNRNRFHHNFGFTGVGPFFISNSVFPSEFEFV
jgi:hypothetical protein